MLDYVWVYACDKTLPLSLSDHFPKKVLCLGLTCAHYASLKEITSDSKAKAFPAKDATATCLSLSFVTAEM